MKTLTILLVLIFALTTYAEVINIPDDYETIQEGISRADDGDVVAVESGVYRETISFLGKAISIIGDPEHPEEVVIDGGRRGSVVSFTRREDQRSILNGFTLRNGRTDEHGGGVKCINSSPILLNLIVHANRADVSGGGISCYTNSNPQLFQVLIRDNLGRGHGGGMSCYGNSNPELLNVIISDNISSGYGGGIYCSSSNPTLTEVEIRDNAGVLSGGGITCIRSEPVLVNTAVIGNETGAHGGAVYCNQSNPMLVNVTASGNSADDNEGFGDGIYLTNQSEPEVINSIFWDNLPHEIYFSENGEANSITISYSDLDVDEDELNQRDEDDLIWGEGIINDDPLFADPEEGNFHLTEDSPCIDTGDPDSPEDPDGTRADMGAYYFDQRRDPDDDGILHVPDEYETIQEAIDTAEDGDTVLVDPGEYVENINFDGKAIAVIGNPDDPGEVVIDGDDNGPCVLFASDEGNESQLIGFTLTNGDATGDGYGGGILIEHSSPTISYNIITGNSADQGGGGLSASAEGCEPVITHNLFYDNGTDGGGGGLSFYECGGIVLNNTIVGNSAGQGGGGINIPFTRGMQITNNIVVSNEGSGIAGWNAEEYTLTFNDVWDNQGGNYSNVQADDGSISDDPEFVNADEADYHLTEDSPCIDTGDPDLPEDPDGTRADMGAYYFHQNFPPEQFDLLLPEDGAAVVCIDTTTFTWEASNDPNPDDEVIYFLVVNGLDHEGVEVIEAHVFEVDTNSFDLVFTDVGVMDGGDNYLPFEWFVYAVSGSDSTESENHFAIFPEPSGSVGSDENLPVQFALRSIHPNPFNAQTRLTYSLPVASQLSLNVYNSSGQLISTLYDGVQSAGNHTLLWHVKGLSAGIYFIRMESDGHSNTRKIVLIK